MTVKRAFESLDIMYNQLLHSTRLSASVWRIRFTCWIVFLYFIIHTYIHVRWVPVSDVRFFCNSKNIPNDKCECDL